ncbi:unnamed protein product [Rotaria socialis]|uniref:Uncharacterized protein n=2 Tax=Rotaria socialis TaxID=392032 RepID=A0A818PQ37_9BILA|nr:unnamed protein product [Rotaria socialis]CAF3395492.1 unnamed protein product [Rotaria socialis]CAF3625359.1 unnamed protein product [Rotaria socialis]
MASVTSMGFLFIVMMALSGSSNGLYSCACYCSGIYSISTGATLSSCTTLICNSACQIVPSCSGSITGVCGAAGIPQAGFVTTLTLALIGYFGRNLVA